MTLQQVNTSPTPPMLAVAAVVAGVDVALVLTLGLAGGGTDRELLTLLARASGPALAAGHGAWTALVAVWLWRNRDFYAHSPGLTLLLILMAFLGPAGAVLGLAVLGLSTWLPSVVGPPAALPRDAETQAEETLLRVARQSGDLEPQPLCDVFRRGTLAQKRRAVALIGANFKPQFAEALRMALRDSNNAIRVQAGMVLLQLEDEFGARQVAIESGKHPAVQGAASPQNRTILELARLYDQQAYSGVLDPTRTKMAQNQALKAYRDHLQVEPDNEEAIHAVGRLLVRADQPHLVADWFGEQLRERQISDNGLLWLAEALFRTQRFAELQELIHTHSARLAAGLPAESPLQDMLRLWQAPQPTRPATSRFPAVRTTHVHRR